MKFKFLSIVLLASLTVSSGCFVATAPVHRNPFKVEPLNAVLVVGVDLSGSFAADFGERAFPLLKNVMQRFFVESMGEESRIVLAQISGTGDEQVVLFDGTPRELRRRFVDPASLSDFLLEHSNPKASPVFQAIGKMLSYVNQMPDIGEDTRVMGVIISDLKDSETDKKAWKKKGEKMLEELEAYQARNGAIGLYYVDLGEIALWNRVLAHAGFEPGDFVITNDLVEDPPLPSFD